MFFFERHALWGAFAFHSPTIAANSRMRYCNNSFTKTSFSSKAPKAFGWVPHSMRPVWRKLSKCLILMYTSPLCGMKRQRGKPMAMFSVPPLARGAGAGAEGWESKEGRAVLGCSAPWGSLGWCRCSVVAPSPGASQFAKIQAKLLNAG